MIEPTGKPVFNNLPKVATQNIHHILLADDDVDDCLLFKDALDELQILAKFTTVHNGEHLMQLLNSDEPLPDILFLDINMPRKNGFECLLEIMETHELKTLPVVIMSTAFNQNINDRLRKNGASQYIRKCTNFSEFKALIGSSLQLIGKSNLNQ